MEHLTKNELSCSGYAAFCTSVVLTIHYTMPNMCNQNYIESKIKLVIFVFILNVLSFLYKNFSFFNILERTSEAIASPERDCFKGTPK